MLQPNPPAPQYAPIQRFAHLYNEQTAEKILDIAESEMKAPPIFQTARLIVAGIRERDPASEALAIRTWTRQHLRFVNDPKRVELFYGPLELIRLIQLHGSFAEDCDSHAGLNYALLRSIGQQVRLAACGFIPGTDALQHIYTETRIEGLWVAVDSTLPDYLIPYMLGSIQYKITLSAL